MPEADFYRQLASLDHELLLMCQADYPGQPQKALDAAAEYVYFDEHQKLPEWGYVIERVGIHKGGRVFVHRGSPQA